VRNVLATHRSLTMLDVDALQSALPVRLQPVTMIVKPVLERSLLLITRLINVLTNAHLDMHPTQTRTVMTVPR
jgi:hypothetical protein